VLKNALNCTSLSVKLCELLAFLHVSLLRWFFIGLSNLKSIGNFTSCQVERNPESSYRVRCETTVRRRSGMRDEYDKRKKLKNVSFDEFQSGKGAKYNSHVSMNYWHNLMFSVELAATLIHRRMQIFTRHSSFLVTRLFSFSFA
jgi:hypothetical protein